MNIKAIVAGKAAAIKMSGVKLALVFAALLVVPFVAFTGSASASWPTKCASGALCVYEHANGGGLVASWGGTWDRVCWNLTSTMNNKISSIDNRMSIRIAFFEDSNCSAPMSGFMTISANKQLSVGDQGFPPIMNDRISSLMFRY